MLNDQAQLIQVYSRAFLRTQEPLFKRITEKTVNYVLSKLKHREGGFYSAEDADSLSPTSNEIEEGAFYTWEKSQIDKILGVDSPAYCQFYGVKDGGNVPHNVVFKNVNILSLRMTDGLCETFLEECNQKLYRERETRCKPFLDQKIITSWNGISFLI